MGVGAMSKSTHFFVWLAFFFISIVGYSPTILATGFSDDALVERLVRANIEQRSRKLREDLASRYEKENQSLLQRSRAAADHEAQLVAMARAELEKLAADENKPPTAVAALFRLATLTAEINAGKAIAYVDRARKIVLKTPYFPSDLAASVMLLMGDLELLVDEPSKAEIVFRAALAYRGTMTARQLVHSLVGLGDAAYFQADFETAQAKYEEALDVATGAEEIAEPVLAEMIPTINARLLWSSFRSGNSQRALVYALEFSRNSNDLLTKLPESIAADTIRVGGVALFDANRIAEFIRFANDPAGGDLAKRMIIRSFAQFREAGRADEVNAIASTLFVEFRRSSWLLEFYEEWLRCLNTADMPGKALALGVRAVEELRRGSAWWRQQVLTRPREHVRVRLVSTIAVEYADRLLADARRTGSRSGYLQAVSIYTAALSEEFLPRSRQQILAAATEAAWRGGDLVTAWSLARDGVQLSGVESEKRDALFLLVAVARERASGATSIESPAVVSYFDSVDTFAAAFPQDSGAQDALQESARFAQHLKAYDESQSRFERCLLLLRWLHDVDNDNSEGGFLAAREQDRLGSLMSALVEVVFSKGDSKGAVESLERVSRMLLTARLPSAVRLFVEQASAAAVRDHAATQRRAGNIAVAALFMVNWSERNPTNPETPGILRDGVRELAVTGMWNDLIRSAAIFRKNFVNNKFFGEVIYWEGRAHEVRLSFRQAVASYLKATSGQYFLDDDAERQDALNRARYLALELGDTLTAVEVIRRLADLAVARSENDSAADLYLAAVRLLLRERRFQEARDLAALVRGSVLADAERELCLGEIELLEDRDAGLARLSRLLTLHRRKGSQSSERLSEVHDQALFLVTERIRSDVEDIRNRVRADVLPQSPRVAVKSWFETARQAQESLQWLVSNRNFAQTYSAYTAAANARILTLLADTILAANGAADSVWRNVLGSDVQRARDFHALAHQRLAQIFRTMPTGTPERAIVSHWLRRYTEVQLETAWLLNITGPLEEFGKDRVIRSAYSDGEGHVQ